MSNNGTYKPTDKELEQLFSMLNEIATNAKTLSQICSQGISAYPDDKDAMLSAAEGLANNLGWMADHGTGIIRGTGSPNCIGDAEDWFLPPQYHAMKVEKEEVA